MPHFTHNKRGFIAIVALGIFMLLSVFGIIVQRTTITTINNIRITNDYYRASDIADGAMEYMQNELAMHEAGYNFKSSCFYGDTSGTNNDPNGICNSFQSALSIENENIEINLDIMGRSDEGEGFVNSPTGVCPGVFSGSLCYVTPIPGTGNAGERCDLYDQDIDEPDATVDHNGQIGPPGTAGLPNQIDYSCNWNKISFGSSSTDRVAIPFYYDAGTEILNPFNTLTDPATQFSIRVRPPCKPCNDRSYGSCGADETICTDSERYKLDALTPEDNQVAVQWQMSGMCDDGHGGEEECGLVQIVDKDARAGIVTEIETHAITERRINNNASYPRYVSLFSQFPSFGIITTETEVEEKNILLYLNEASSPLLSLFLVEKLISDSGDNIPYLEYQILTDKPIGSPKTFAVVSVNVNGYVFEKTLAIEQDKPLIDFAVQN